MPGVLIIEALAQMGCVAMLSVEEYKGKTGYFGGIDNANSNIWCVRGTDSAWSVRSSNREDQHWKGSCYKWMESWQYLQN